MTSQHGVNSNPQPDEPHLESVRLPLIDLAGAMAAILTIQNAIASSEDELGKQVTDAIDIAEQQLQALIATQVKEALAGQSSSLSNANGEAPTAAALLQARIDERKKVAKAIRKEIGRPWALPRDTAGKRVETIVKDCADYLLTGLEQDQKNSIYELERLQAEGGADV